MKVRINDPVLAQALTDEITRVVEVGTVFQAYENNNAWEDEDGKSFAYGIILEASERTCLTWWVHDNEVELLTPSEELATYGIPGCRDEFAEQVLLYMVENDCSPLAAMTIITGKDIHVTGEDHG